ncbi:hypothetical protein B566_EDAN010912 [Ephemera danica]|nr:hypothetical protein B566_EDAN010912 [Ephemera danica]
MNQWLVHNNMFASTDTMRTSSILIIMCVGFVHLQEPAQAQREVGDRCNNAAGTGGAGRCVEARSCAIVMAAVRRDDRAMSPETLRLLQDAHCGFTNKSRPLVCCKVVDEDIVDSPLNSEPGQWLDQDGGVQAPAGTTVTEDHPKLSLLPIIRCGHSSFDRIGRPVNTLIESDEAPTVVRLLYTTSRGSEEQFRCGGSLISSRYVLTSARCVTGLAHSTKLSSVVLGDFDVNSDPDCGGAAEMDLPSGWSACRPRARRLGIESVTVHPAYRPRARRPDLALLRLDRNVNFTAWELIPTCLPLGAFQFLELRGRGRGSLITMGWGTDLRARIACAEGRTQEDSKVSDMGGPLSVVEAWADQGPRMVQVAVLSVRVKDEPAAFTRLGPYLTWILEVLQP